MLVHSRVLTGEPRLLCFDPMSEHFHQPSRDHTRRRPLLVEPFVGVRPTEPPPQGNLAGPPRGQRVLWPDRSRRHDARKSDADPCAFDGARTMIPEARKVSRSNQSWKCVARPWTDSTSGSRPWSNATSSKHVSASSRSNFALGCAFVSSRPSETRATAAAALARPAAHAKS